MSTDLELVLPAITPAVPLILADRKFLSTLATVEQQVSDLKITDAATQQLAADLQVRLTTAGRELDKTRTALKAPFLAKSREIDEVARDPLARIEAAKNAIKGQLTAFAVEQARLAAVAEAARQAELRRLEAIRLAEEKAAANKALALAQQAEAVRKQREADAEAARLANLPPPVVLMDVQEDDCPDDEPPQKTEVEKQIEAVRYAPTAVVAKPVGVAFKTRLVLKVTDPKLVPDIFVTRVVNEQAIRATYCTGWKQGQPVPSVPGCAFTAETDVASTGRTF